MPFYPPNSPKNQNFEKMEKLLEISSFYICASRIMIRWCTVPEICCTTDGWTDGQKKWQIEVGPPTKNCSETGRFSKKGGVSKLFYQFSFRKACFHCVFFHVVYNEIIYYEISFFLTLIFKFIFVKILLLIIFIYIYISLKASNILENKSKMFEKSDCTIT